MITSKDVEHVAKLARLALTEDEKRLYTDQLSRILEYFAQLNAVNTDGVEPMSHALPVVNVLREDVVETPPGHKTLLATAPDAETVTSSAPDGTEESKSFFRVPKIGD
ncbi:MAG: Asp-tRNA(Asn)/Glu-tRNA(Gln) amidotransferase subunit GatC [Candidatus Melainabacteria bacterium]|nr:Asp-tRNA(Asn)/Glu-tRNA(Gln) amidotransferase subunit GatC [Candidatus Melainabacteria bacterium]